MSEAKVISSFIWKFLERTGTYLMQFIIQLVLARILLPEEYGIVAIVTVFITIANVFVQTGFNTSLIQKKDADDLDFSSVCYLSLFVALILYVLLFFSAPYIADFYNISLITPVLRVLSLNLFLGAFHSVQNAYVSRKMDFKRYFYSSLVAIIISGIVGIIMAYNGFGIWSLVTQQLLNMAFVIIILLFVIKWKPKLCFSFKRTKQLFSYGWKLLVSSLIDNLYTNLYDLIIGKKYTTSDLAYYNRGKQFPYLIIANVNGSISSVLLPAMSKKQDDKNCVKEMTRKAIVISSFVMFPLMFGLIAVAKPLVSFLLTDKWIDCVPFLQILCLSYVWWPIHTANLQAINSLGRSDIFLKLEIIKKVIGILIIVITVPFGIYALALGQVVTGILSSFINAYPNKKLLNYSYFEQIKDIAPSFVVSIIMAALIYPITFIKTNSLFIIIIQVVAGIVIYGIINFIFKNEILIYLVKILKNKRKVSKI